MKTLVFGNNGQVASALKIILPTDDTTFLGRAEADLMEPGTAAAQINAHMPEVVINAAAYTHVDKAETEKDAATQLNASAPTEMAKAASAIEAAFIHISTDYVFDGSAEDHRYNEDDAVNPLNFYGRSKLDGERAVMDSHARAVIMRTSWVFSEFGGNFVKTMLRLAEDREALTIVADQIGGPTSASAIANAIMTIAGKLNRGADGAGIYHFQGAPTVSWADFARAIFSAADKNVTVSDIPTSDYPTPAQRPLRTRLDCARIERDFGIAQPDWQVDLGVVLNQLSPPQND